MYKYTLHAKKYPSVFYHDNKIYKGPYKNISIIQNRYKQLKEFNCKYICYPITYEDNYCVYQPIDVIDTNDYVQVDQRYVLNNSNVKTLENSDINLSDECIIELVYTLCCCTELMVGDTGLHNIIVGKNGKVAIIDIDATRDKVEKNEYFYLTKKPPNTWISRVEKCIPKIIKKLENLPEIQNLLISSNSVSRSGYTIRDMKYYLHKCIRKGDFNNALICAYEIHMFSCSVAIEKLCKIAFEDIGIANISAVCDILQIKHRGGKFGEIAECVERMCSGKKTKLCKYIFHSKDKNLLGFCPIEKDYILHNDDPEDIADHASRIYSGCIYYDIRVFDVIWDYMKKHQKDFIGYRFGRRSAMMLLWDIAYKFIGRHLFDTLFCVNMNIYSLITLYLCIVFNITYNIEKRSDFRYVVAKKLETSKIKGEYVEDVKYNNDILREAYNEK